MTFVKICCIANVEEARGAIAAGAHGVGLVGPMPSGPGVIDDATIKSVTSVVLPPTQTFFLTSEITAEAIFRQVMDLGPSTVQIVNHIDVAESRKLSEILPTTRRVQVIHIEDMSAIDMISIYAPFVDAFLLDSGKPSLEIPELGGTGRCHDWNISKLFVQSSPLPVYLAGGLRPSNVREAIMTVRPYGVDLCSGVRTENKLDLEKLAEFMNIIQSTDNELSNLYKTQSVH